MSVEYWVAMNRMNQPDPWEPMIIPCLFDLQPLTDEDILDIVGDDKPRGLLGAALGDQWEALRPQVQINPENTPTMYG